MYRSILLLFFIAANFSCYSQAGFKVEYFSSEGKLVTTKEESYYYELTKNNLVDGDTVVTFYTQNDGLRSVSVVNNQGVPNGLFTNYYESGKIKAKGNKKHGGPEGVITSYYENGLIQAVEVYNSEEDQRSTLMSYYDSSGIELIKNGNGFCKCFFDSHRLGSNYALLEIGKLTSGWRDSVWTGYKTSGNLYFVENYKKYKLVSGISYDSLGNEFSYTEIEIPATPTGGMQSFYQHVGKTLRYPVKARRAGVQGMVFVEFVVNTDGSISNVKSIKGIGFECDEEAERAIKTSPKWIPGVQRGQFVRQRMILPLTFKLG